MRRFRWPLLILVLCLPVALLALGVDVTRLGGGRRAVPKAVPPPDQELAWLHTSTHGANWERFVSGLKRVQMAVPGLTVDDTDAFPEMTFATPEVVMTLAGREGKLRVRWYKLTSETDAPYWVGALARRDPAPLALIGGGSSDRALDLARALAGQWGWRGDRPLLLITTATADDYDEAGAAGAPTRLPTRLIDAYPNRSFRFCFTNKQMAEAVVDFVSHDPTLRPGPVAWPGLRAVPLAAAGGWTALAGLADVAASPAASVFTVAWQDDPYSTDLSWQFQYALHKNLRPESADDESNLIRFFQYNVPYSVGSLTLPNRHEAELADAILKDLPPSPARRSLLVVPTVAPPARRLLKTLCDADPFIGRRLVAVTGDGIGLNSVYRDGRFAWPVRSLPVPLVLFMHNNPFGWDQPSASPAPPPGYDLRPPTSTEDVLHFADMGRFVVEAAFPPPGTAQPATTGGVLTRADDLAKRLRERSPPFFDAAGNRLGGTGEYVVVLRPNIPDGTGPATHPDAVLDTYRRTTGTSWERVRSLPVGQHRKPGQEGGPE